MYRRIVGFFAMIILFGCEVSFLYPKCVVILIIYLKYYPRVHVCGGWGEGVHVCTYTFFFVCVRKLV